MEMPSREKETVLSLIAQEQGGYFTSKQAQSAGYTYSDQNYHTKTGDWTRIHRAVYKLANYPLPLRDDLIVMTLLSHDRAGNPQAVVSHETALALHEISDANPANIHLTVPAIYRKQMPPGVILHKAFLAPKDWEQREGYRVTTPLRTILDTARSQSSWPYLTDAIYDALQKGLVRASQIALEATNEGNQEIKTWLLRALQVAEQRTSRKANTYAR
jgi:predicted transcriptional regulator of viral defense system